LDSLFPDASRELQDRICELLATLEQRTLSGEYRDFSAVSEAMQETEQHIMNILGEFDIDSQHPVSAVESCNFPRLDLIRLFSMEEYS
jgi:hypothetical protein